jgi:hypothetical protein
LWCTAEAQAGRLLRVLLLRLCPVSADTGREGLLLAFAIFPGLLSNPASSILPSGGLET